MGKQPQFGKNILCIGGERNSRKAWIGALALRTEKHQWVGENTGLIFKEFFQMIFSLAFCTRVMLKPGLFW